MRAVLLTALFLAGVAAAGCSELPAKGEGCGNGVIDRGESCDSTGGSCDDDCNLHCTQDVDCMAAGEAYMCGADLVCHAPSGVFRRQPVTDFGFPVGGGTIADIDGDAIGDVVGFSDVNIDVRFGDTNTELTTRATEIVPYANTNIQLRQLAGSAPARAISDLLLPTPDGIAGFTARGKSVVSYPFSNSAGERGACASIFGAAQPRESFAIDKHHVAFISRYNATGTLALVVLDPAQPTKCAHVDLCDYVPATNPASMDPFVFFDHYELPGAQLSSMIAVASPLDVDPATNLGSACVVRFDDNAGTFNLTAALKLDVGEGPIAFARAQQDQPCPALFVRGRGAIAPIDRYRQTPTTPCFIQTTGVTSFGIGDQFPSGHIAVSPKPPGSPYTIEPDVLGIVTAQGFGGSTAFYQLQNGTLGPVVYNSSRPLYPLRYADLDGDGSIEGIGAVGPIFQGSNPDIEVLYRTNTPTLGFVPYRIATQVTPSFLELGDFDGNSLTDIAYIESLGDHDRLMIAYGTRDRVLDPAEIATFHRVGTICRMDIADSIDPQALALDDLLVIDLVRGTEDQPDNLMALSPQLALLHGNPQRSMLAYYEPRAQFGNPNSLLVAAVPGQFVAGKKAGLLAFELRTDQGTPVQDSVNLWTAAGSNLTNGFVDAEPTPTNTTKIGVTKCGIEQTLCMGGVQFVSWPLANGHDVVLAADAPQFPGVIHTRTVVTIDPTSANAVRANPGAELPLSQPATSMWSADVDGSGTQRLVVSLPLLRIFNPTATGEEEVRVCDVDSEGSVTACPKLTELVADLQGFQCGAAETGRIAGKDRFAGGALGTQGMLALCAGPTGDKAIYRVHPAGDALVAEVVISNVGPYQFLAVGDLNGDFADDVVGIAFDPTGQPFVFVHTQCDAHDRACIAENTAPVLEGAAP